MRVSVISYHLTYRWGLAKTGAIAVIDVLNTRASIYSEEGSVPKAIEEAFKAFLVVLDDHWGKEPEKALTLLLGHVYAHFLQAVQQYGGRRKQHSSSMQ